MAYTYLNEPGIRKDLNEYCLEIIHQVQKELSDYFTFDIRLIGSGLTRLITVNGNNKHIDLDYNLIIQRDYEKLISEPRKIRDLFLDSFKKAVGNKLTAKVRNSTSVLTTYLGKIGKYNFSFDCAIMVGCNDGCLYKIIFDKRSQNFIWNKVKDSKDLMYKFTKLKQNGYWQQIKDTYLSKKNDYISDDSYTSSMIFMETINDIYQKVNK